jgi:hypothetical protein
MPRAASVVITGQLAVVQSTGHVAITVNGSTVQRVAAADQFQPFPPISATLRAGENVVQLHNPAGAQRAGPGERLLSLAIRDLSIVLAGGSSTTLGSPIPASCEWQT